MKRFISLITLVTLVTSLILIPYVASANELSAWADDPLIPLFLPSILSNYTTAQTIQGKVTDEASNPISGVVVTDDQGHAAITDSDGNYTIEGLIPGTYTIVPSNGNYAYWPDSRTLDIPPASEGQNFFASAMDGCSERIENGGFETNGDWEFPITVYPADFSLHHVHSGTRSVRTGISELNDNIYSYSSIRQVAIIPASSTSVILGFWIRPMTTEPSGKPIPLLPTGTTFGDEPLAYDAQYILVLDQNNNLLETLLWQRRHSIGYEYHHMNLLRYAGQTIKIEFGTYNDGYDGITTMYVDDVSLITCDTALPTSTPTVGPSPTVTSTPGDCVNLIANSSFETKDSWYIPITEYTAGYSSVRSHTGDYSMRTGITDIDDNTYSFSDAGQVVTIPSNATSVTLGLWIYPKSGDPGLLTLPGQPLAKTLRDAPLSGDLQYVLILDQYDNWIDTLIWQRADSGQWEYNQFNLKEYRGMKIKIHFGSMNDGWGGITSMFVDDVFLTYCTTALPTSTVTPTRTITPTPTATRTPGPTRTSTATAVCRNELDNSSFEATRDWIIPLTEYPAAYSIARSHSGERSMRTGIISLSDNRYSYSDARQAVTIPGDATNVTLRIWLYPISGEIAGSPVPPIPDRTTFRFGEEPLAGDVQYILVLDEYGNWIDTLFWQRRDDTSWVYYQFDLDEFAGDMIQIHFGTYNDGYSGVTGMYVDDAELEICR